MWDSGYRQGRGETRPAAHLAFALGVHDVLQQRGHFVFLVLPRDVQRGPPLHPMRLAAARCATALRVERSPGADVGGGEPSPGADVAAVSAVPVQIVHKM